MRSLLTIDEDLSYLPGVAVETIIELTTCDMEDDRLDLEFRNPKDRHAWVVCLTEPQIADLLDTLTRWLKERVDARIDERRADLMRQAAAINRELDRLAAERAASKKES